MVHEWRDTTDEGPRLFKATRFARRWSLATRLKAEEAWTALEDPFPIEVLERLRDLLWAKYQRRRVPFEIVREIDMMLPADQRRIESE
jgi:hypothetical protein